MRRVIAGLFLVAACGGAAKGPAEVTIGGPASAPQTSATARAILPVDATLPEDAAAVATVDMAALQRLFAHFFQSNDEGDDARSERQRGLRELEKALGVGKGSLGPDRAFDTIGLDASRPASIALASISASGRTRIAALDALARKPAPKVGHASTLFEDIKAALGSETGTLRLRALVPVKDGAAAKRALRHLLAEENYRDVAPPPGVDLLVHARRVVLAVSADDTWLAVDVIKSRFDVELSASEVVAAITDLRAHAENGAPALELAAAELRARYVPRRVAEIGFLEGVAATATALVNVDADQQVRITAAGLAEAHRALELAGSERGEFFRAVEITGNPSAPAGKPLLTATATFGPGEGGDPKAALAAPRGVGIDGAGTFSLLDVSAAAGLALHFPGDAPNALLSESESNTRIREAGWSGWVVAAPLLPLLLMSTPLRPPPDAFSPKSAALRLERVGLVEPMRGRGEIWLGVLRAGTSESEASCVLAGSAPCARRALKLGAPPTKIGDRWVRLAKAGDRFVVTIGDDVTALETYRPSLGPSGAPPLRMRLSVDALRSRLAAVMFGDKAPPILTSTGEISDTALTIRVEAAP